MPQHQFTNIQVFGQEQNETIPACSDLLIETITAQKAINQKVKLVKKVAKGMIKAH